MAPKKRLRPDGGQTEEEQQVEREAQRLRSRAEGHLLQSQAPTSSTAGSRAMPVSLRKSDGADIVKRNATRKKKYLVVFPGAAALPPGARVGELTGLDTRTPVLYVDIPPHGRVKLRGSLVFPKNSFIAVKGPSSAKKPVQVIDSFETLVVFSEWAWIGDENANPGQVPEPLPAVLRREGQEVPELWRVAGYANGESRGAIRSSASVPLPASRKLDARKELGVKAVDEIVADGSESPIVIEDDDDIGLESEGQDGRMVGSSEDSDEWDMKNTKVDVVPRTNSRRKRKVVNYAQMLDDESSDDAGEESENDNDNDGGDNQVDRAEPEADPVVFPRRTRKRISLSQLSDDDYEEENDDSNDPGYDLGTDLADSDS